MTKEEFVNWEDFAEFKKDISYLNRVICTAEPSCTYWKRDNFCTFPGELRIGRMGTCLSMEPPEDFGKTWGFELPEKTRVSKI